MPNAAGYLHGVFIPVIARQPVSRASNSNKRSGPLTVRADGSLVSLSWCRDHPLTRVSVINTITIAHLNMRECVRRWERS